MGTRIPGPQPKQFARLGALPVLAHTLHRCAEALAFDHILLTLPEGYQVEWEQAYRNTQFAVSHQVVTGGAERSHSVKNALAQLIARGAQGWVGIHDGVRPFVNPDLVQRTFQSATKDVGAVPVTKPKDSLRFGEAGCWQPLDREHVRIVQTPQVFEIQKLWQAYQKAGENPATDDAQIWENAGFELKLLEGDPGNFKLTTEADMTYAHTVFQNGTTFHANG